MGVGKAHEDPLSSAAVRRGAFKKQNVVLRKLPRKRSIANGRKETFRTPETARFRRSYNNNQKRKAVWAYSVNFLAR